MSPPNPIELLVQGINYPWRLISGRLASGEAAPASGLKPGEGKVLQVGDEKLAVYRDPDAGLIAVSPICTHFRCVVHFNDADRTWDCPCHGSRFKADGAVLKGPASKPLERKEISEQSG
jgi:Rieske Fe-S protein